MSDNAESQARAQVESIVSMVAALNCDYARLQELRDMKTDPDRYIMDADESEELAELESVADYESEDEAREAILQDALSVEVRSGWTNVDALAEIGPEEFRIVLCTGGPHVEIVGELDRGTPTRARVLYRDWGTSGELFDFDRDAVLTYCQQFYFGE